MHITRTNQIDAVPALSTPCPLIDMSIHRDVGELHTAHHVLRILPSRYFWSYRLNIQHNGEGCFNIENIENYGFN